MIRGLPLKESPAELEAGNALKCPYNDVNKKLKEPMAHLNMTLN